MRHLQARPWTRNLGGLLTFLRSEPPERSRERRYRQAAELLREWKGDETGYDDEVWPLVEGDLAPWTLPSDSRP